MGTYLEEMLLVLFFLPKKLIPEWLHRHRVLSSSFTFYIWITWPIPSLYLFFVFFVFFVFFFFLQQNKGWAYDLWKGQMTGMHAPTQGLLHNCFDHSPRCWSLLRSTGRWGPHVEIIYLKIQAMSSQFTTWTAIFYSGACICEASS